MNILPLTYLGNIQYFTKLCFSECVIDVHEHFVKQSYRSRCDILGGNGPMALTVPTARMDNEHKCTVRDTRIDYSKRWQHQHWQSIRSAYYGSPCFDFYREELEPFYERKYTFLLDFNMELTRLMLRWLGCRREPVLSEEYITPPGVDGAGCIGTQSLPWAGGVCEMPQSSPADGADGKTLGGPDGMDGSAVKKAPGGEGSLTDVVTDYRDALSPKPRLWQPDPGFVPEPYYQVFSDRMAFVPNLSVIDLLFCEGPGAPGVLRASVR